MMPGHALRGSLHALLVLAGLQLGMQPVLAVPGSPSPPESRDAAPVRPREGSTYEHPQTRQLVDLVEEAASQIQQRGETTFPDFRRKGSRWYRGDRYLFVLDLEGNRHVYPPDPRNERLNVLEDRDLGGKMIGRMLINRAREAQGRGWVHYQWNRPNPDDRRPVWKSTYVVKSTAPSGKTYLVGSGLYEAPMEKAFLVQEVEAATALLRREGRAGFARLRDRNDRFFFRDTYVFVNDAKGVELVNAGFPSLEGRNLMALRDAEGKLLVRDYIDLALRDGEGWTSYLWPEPDRSPLPLRKHTFVKKVVLSNGETLIVGAGLYEP